MKGTYSNGVSPSNDLTISKSEAHQLVDRIFAIEEARLKNEKLGVVEILDVPSHLEKKEAARIINDHTKVHMIDAWLGLCCEVPYLVYCDSVYKLSNWKRPKSKGNYLLLLLTQKSLGRHILSVYPKIRKEVLSWKRTLASFCSYHALKSEQL